MSIREGVGKRGYSFPMSEPQRSPVLDPSNDGRKLAPKIAELLEQEIIDAGWPVGRVMGSESELLARLGVSRAVLREAIRVLEHHDVAFMRRGPGGGLVVKAPDSAAAVRACALSLGFRDATWEQVFEARRVLELRSVEMAARDIDETGIASLREALAAEERAQEAGIVGTHDLHITLAEITGNPAFVLFIDVLTQLSSGGGSPERAPAAATEVRRAHDKIVEAVIAGDASLARHRMQAHLNAMGPWLNSEPAALQHD
ncbi:FCD domain-containing protein [Rhodococcus sp. T2V]|uniref:FadR/GntR family transcriptional regulator n=1 Tax=Rhodococcus sp. T2V TaxID=3034164 RepID=UPI0023E2AC04|nr:FCD domain-containing protein [Rhodococcus sp. T2V]MDF3310064.1 FCD domain-containing protein [Rhodococcus sp. T2V]